MTDYYHVEGQTRFSGLPDEIMVQIDGFMSIKRETGVMPEPIRYVRERTCHVECFDDGVDEAVDGEWFSYGPPTWYLSCGHQVQGSECPAFCTACGAKVVDE